MGGLSGPGESPPSVEMKPPAEEPLEADKMQIGGKPEPVAEAPQPMEEEEGNFCTPCAVQEEEPKAPFEEPPPMQAAAAVETPPAASPSVPKKKKQKNTSKCYLPTCKKKIGLTGFKCRCGYVFCGIHRYADAHNCDFDYKTTGRAELAKENPEIVAAKLAKI